MAVRRRCHPPEISDAQRLWAQSATAKLSKGVLTPAATSGRDLGPATCGQAAARATDSCQGVRIRGPAAVTAIVNSKCADSDPSWE